MTHSPNRADATEADELANTEALLNELDPALLTSPETDTSDLRRISDAAEAIVAAREALGAAVAAAKAGGRSWGQIGMVLGVSKQAARERFGTPAPRTATD
jgi:hypothetical protein